MDHSFGWYSGYTRALSKLERRPLTPEDRYVLAELADLLRRMHDAQTVARRRGQ